MRLRFIIIALVASGLACSGGALDHGGTGGDGSGGSVETGSGTGVGTGVAGIGDDPGTAGSVGTAGSAGDTGGSAGPGGSVGAGGSSQGGTGGTSITGTAGRPMLPACTGTGTDGGGASILGPDGMPVTTPVTAAVTVASIDGCAAEPCPPPAAYQARKIVLASADQTQWTLSLYNSVMPPDLIQVGDAFDLTVNGGVDATFYPTVNQTVVLSRAGQLIAFGSSTNQFYRLGLPNLAAFGVDIADGGAVCGGPKDVTGCIPETHALVVTVDGSSATVMPGHASTIGWLSFAPGNTTVLADSGYCDAKSVTGMAGFRLP